jgi:polar amino acid transport system substrate-binding protein
LALLLAGCSHHLGTVNLSAKSPVLARIQKQGVLVVGTMGGMPPLNMTTKEGKIIGFEADLARYMADSMGVELKLKQIQFSKLLPSLEAGKIDMILSGMTMTSRRNLRVAFVGPYMVSGKAILTSQATLAAITDPNQVDKKEYKIAAL